MAYCRKCGEVIDDEAVFCPKCGVQQQALKTDAPNDDGDVLWAIVGFLIPVVGIALWLIWMHEKPKCARMAGIGALASLLVGAAGAAVALALMAW